MIAKSVFCKLLVSSRLKWLNHKWHFIRPVNELHDGIILHFAKPCNDTCLNLGLQMTYRCMQSIICFTKIVLSWMHLLLKPLTLQIYLVWYLLIKILSIDGAVNHTPRVVVLTIKNNAIVSFFDLWFCTFNHHWDVSYGF